MKLRRGLPLLAVGLLAAARPAGATSFVMVSDADLARQAAVIAVVRVLGSTPAPAAGLPATDYRVAVLAALKGEVPGGLATVRVTGGDGAGGVGYRVWGAPRFAGGERAILFLLPYPDGTYRVLHLMLGAFHLLGEGGGVALRDLSEAAEVERGSGGEVRVVPHPTDLPRDAGAFAAWLRDLAGGRLRAADYFRPELASRYSLLTASDGFRVRWFDFDGGGSISWQADSRGQPGLAGGGFSELQTALAAWNGDAGTDVRYRYTGTTASTQTNCAPPNRVGRLVFDDPAGDIAGSFSCASGGVLAQGGPCYFTSLSTYQGVQYHPEVDAFIVTNDGLSCFFTGRPSPVRAAEELFAHELGHTLGLGHSSDHNALMYAFLHDDGRGAALQPDDRAGLAVLYGTGGGPPPGPAAPSQLAATALSSAEVGLTWQDNSADETEFRIERRITGAFAQIAAVAANVTTYTAVGLAAETRYEFRVRAANGAGLSAYSNVAAATTGPALPAAPSHLVATPLSPTAVALTWQDNSADEASFRVEVAGFGGFSEVAVLAADVTGYTVTGLDPAALYLFRVRGHSVAGFSAYSNQATATTPGVPGPCVPDVKTLCLLDGAVRVQVNWRNQHGAGGSGVGRAVPGTRESGSFWFFSSDNLELVVKAVDGSAVNGHYWLFYGALSDVEYWVRVTRAPTGEAVVYHNPPGEICGDADVGALSAAATAGASSARALAPIALAPALFASGGEPAPRSGSCAPGPQTLCLLGGRFAVRVDWANQRNGHSGVGGAVPFEDRTGFFWFFTPDKLELVVKALDGTGVNGHYWFFYGALSDVEYHVTVTDTATGASRTYDNAPGNICGEGDVGAF
jgi:Matrixin/Fibronectin type III domain